MVEEIQGWAHAHGAGKGSVSWCSCREARIRAAAFVRSRVPGADLLLAPGKSANLHGGLVCPFQSHGPAAGTSDLCRATVSGSLTADALGRRDLTLVATVRHARTGQSDYDDQRTYVWPLHHCRLERDPARRLSCSVLTVGFCACVMCSCKFDENRCTWGHAIGVPQTKPSSSSSFARFVLAGVLVLCGRVVAPLAPLPVGIALCSRCPIGDSPCLLKGRLRRICLTTAPPHLCSP